MGTQLYGVYRNGTITIPEGTQALVGVDSSGAPDTTGATTVQSGPVTTANVTITSGSSLSTAANLGSGQLVGIIMPSGWTTAAITFQANADGANTFYDVYDDATERTISSSGAAASRFLSLPISDWLAAKAVKIRSGTGAVPVNQGADRVITLVIAH